MVPYEQGHRRGGCFIGVVPCEQGHGRGVALEGWFIMCKATVGVVAS